MSPERLKGEGYYADTDIWSLGLVLLECALGKFPFKLNNELDQIGFWEILSSIEKSGPMELPEDQFSEDFRDFIAITLNKKPGMRSTAGELLEHPFVQKYKSVDMVFLMKWIRTLN